MKEHSIADAYTALDVITCQIQDTDTLRTSCAQEVREVLDDYFALVKHLKNTPLWDVLTYEDRLESPIRILAEDNERLKEENNELLKKLGKTEKYREQRRCKSREPRSFNVGDKVFSKIIDSVGEISSVNPNEKSAVVKFRVGHGPGKTFTCSFAELRKV
mgnify:CR=1 FL=1